MVQTKDRQRAGTTNYVATVYTLVPDEDGQVWVGEGQGVPHREDWVHSNEYKTLDGAWKWVQKQTGSYGDIYRNVWTAYQFEDGEYGVVLDAECDAQYAAYVWNNGFEWVREVG